jgi:hypothetical protein
VSLSERDRTRFARHLLLTQLGEAGQERLLEARLVAPAEADPGALEVAHAYLTRAGAEVLVAGADGASALSLPTTAQVERVAGSAALLEAARALLGALAAVDAIKRVASLGSVSAAGSPQDFLFAISSEDA